MLAALVLVASILLGPLSVLLLGFASRQPMLLLLGMGGLAGLLGACGRVWLGPRFFVLRRWVRLVLVGCLAAGTATAFLAAYALPWHVYWATLVPVLGCVGVVVLAGSIANTSAGA